MDDPGQIPGRRGPDSAGLESTTTLMSLARQGDGDARNRLLRRYLAPLRRWAHGRLPAGARQLLDTDDLVQITLIRALDHMEGFESQREGGFLAYLRRILINRMRDEIRSARRQPERQELHEDMPHGEHSPLEAAIGREALERYEAGLAALPEVQREAVIMRIEMGFSHQEVAEALALPTANAARMMVARAVVRLGEMLHERS